MNLNHSTGSTAWYLLAEFSLQDFLSERSRVDGLMAGCLSLPLQELDGLPEWVANLEGVLARSAKDVGEDFEPDARVRVFCQRKIIDQGSVERGQAFPNPAKKMNGGWGYYAIEKGSGVTGAGKEFCHTIEIYIYRESIDTP